MSLRHERRRRLLADDALDGASDAQGEAPIRLAEEPAGGSQGDAARYAPAARSDRQRRLHELFPTRRLTIALAVAGGLALIGVLLLLHLWSDSLGRILNPDAISALSLRGTRNLSHWFASTLLATASLAAIYIYSLRRHRIDDYHGRYRVWIWIAIGCLAASCAEATDVSEVAHGVCRLAATLSSVSDAVLWPTVVVCVLIAIAVRVFIEVRACRLAVTAAALVVASFLLAAAVEVDWPAVVSQANKPLLERGSWLAGYVLMLGMFLLYARHVMLDVEGRLAIAPSRPKKSKAKSPVHEVSQKRANHPPQKPFGAVRTDLDSAEKGATTRAAERIQLNTTQRKPPAPPAISAGAADQESTRSMSRAERRRLRRESKKAA